MTRIAELHCLVQVSGPTKSTNNHSIGSVEGLAVCQPTRVLSGFRPLADLALAHVLKIFSLHSRPPKVVELSRMATASWNIYHIMCKFVHSNEISVAIFRD